MRFYATEQKSESMISTYIASASGKVRFVSSFFNVIYPLTRLRFLDSERHLRFMAKTKRATVSLLRSLLTVTKRDRSS
jgi:hypothetical protein